jgi:hypothetical protein
MNMLLFNVNFILEVSVPEWRNVGDGAQCKQYCILTVRAIALVPTGPLCNNSASLKSPPLRSSHEQSCDPSW